MVIWNNLENPPRMKYDEKYSGQCMKQPSNQKSNLTISLYFPGAWNNQEWSMVSGTIGG